MPELNIDEEIIKDLKIETVSAQTNTSSEDSLMQNQTPEEIAVKAMINTDTDTFEVKLEQNSETQTMEQTQTKSTEPNPSRIIDQITKQMKGLQNNGKVNIVLNPESLGKVNIQLLNTKEGLTAQFTVTTQEARDLLTKGLDGCLFLYPSNEWKIFEEKLRTLPLTNKNARTFTRFFLGSAVDGGLDKQGRALISSALRAFAGLEKDVVLVGVLDRVEIWDQARWDENNAAVEADMDEIAGQMEDLGLRI